MEIMTMLCSCKINWFGGSYEVPWYFVVIPVLLIMVISFFIIMRGTYICPECDAEFKPKWYQLYVGVHSGNKRLAKCPHCGKKGFCKKKNI